MKLLTIFILMALVLAGLWKCGGKTHTAAPPSPATFCGKSGVKEWYMDSNNESVACFDGNAFQWTRP